jgi:hypothetical protein
MTSKSVLSATARSAIASSFVQALNANENSGSLVTHVCETAHRYLKGQPFDDTDMQATILDISRAKGWKGASLKSRCSEVRVVLKCYATLPDAVSAFRAKANGVQWHDAMKMARKLNAGESVPKAVRAAFESKGVQPKGTPEGRVAGALKGWFKVATGKKRTAILEAAAILGIKLGVKLDA